MRLHGDGSVKLVELKIECNASGSVRPSQVHLFSHQNSSAFICVVRFSACCQYLLACSKIRVHIHIHMGDKKVKGMN